MEHMELQGVIDASPQVGVANILYGPEVLPAIVAFSPFGQTVLKASVNISTGRHQGDSTGLGKGFQASNDCPQRYSIRSRAQLGIRGFQAFAPFDILENETPSSAMMNLPFVVASAVRVPSQNNRKCGREMIMEVAR